MKSFVKEHFISPFLTYHTQYINSLLPPPLSLRVRKQLGISTLSDSASFTSRSPVLFCEDGSEMGTDHGSVGSDSDRRRSDSVRGAGSVSVDEREGDGELTIDRLSLFRRRIGLNCSSSNNDLCSEPSAEEGERREIFLKKEEAEVEEEKGENKGKDVGKSDDERGYEKQTEPKAITAEEKPQQEEEDSDDSEGSEEDEGEGRGEEEGGERGEEEGKGRKATKEAGRTGEDVKKRVRRDIEKRKKKQSRDKRNVSKGKQKNAAKYACKDF